MEPNQTEPCGFRRNAYIVCQGNLCSLYALRCNVHASCCMFDVTDRSTFVGNCKTGEVRLQDGPNVREGRVEVCINNAWGTVCSDQFGFEDAIVTCTQMNFSSEGKT